MPAKEFVIILGNPEKHEDEMRRIERELFNRGYIPVTNLALWPANDQDSLLTNFTLRERNTTFYNWVRTVAAIANLVIIVNIGKEMTPEMTGALAELSNHDLLYVVDPAE